MSLLPNDIHDSWKELLTEDFLKQLGDIEASLDALPKHSSGYAYFPAKEKVMRFLSQDLTNIKCVILGMEPYPSWYVDENGAFIPVATGRSFEIANVSDWSQKFKQTSLRNMLKTVYFNATGKKKSVEEIRKEINDGAFNISQPHEWFAALEDEGVLFLNATLTVEPINPDSHTLMWKDVMNDIIAYIDSHTDTAKWLLFGNKAQERLVNAIGEKDSMYKCSHPRLAEFVDENIFAAVPDVKWDK